MSDPLFSPYVPEDFEQFWKQIAEEAASVPLSFRRRPAVGVTAANGLRLDEIIFDSAEGHYVEGWIAYPNGARRLPSFLWIPPYGRESLLPNAYGTRQGMVSLSLNLHGESAFHQEKYETERGYFSDGALEPETWVFRRMIQHVLVALRVLQAQSEVDEDQIAAMGMSQGGGMSIWAAMVSPILKAVCADMPFLGAMRFALSRTAYRYPLKELVDLMEEEAMGRERVMHTLSYFDTVNCAVNAKLPVQVSYGLKDPAVRPETAQAIFDALPTQKRLVEYPGGHDWHEEMVETNLDWLRTCGFSV